MTIVAEISANHLGSYERAIKLIEVAADAGADAVKLQTYSPDSITLDSDSLDFIIDAGPWAGKKLYDLYKEGHTPREWHSGLFACAQYHGLKCFSSPFSIDDLKFLKQFDPPMYKIASFEITDVNLIQAAANTGKDLIISTGMADQDDIQDALRAAGFASSVILMHCVSKYPTPENEANLGRINWLKTMHHNVGYSDHTLSVIEIPVAALMMGVCMLEKHLTLSRADGGPDAEFSLEPHEFKAMVTAIKKLQPAIGNGKLPIVQNQPHFNLRRSLYVVKNIAAGEEFTDDNVKSIRPGYGLQPKMIHQILGRRAKVDIQCGTALHMELID